MSSIRIVIADGERLFRQCLMVLMGSEPEIEVVGEAADGMEAREKVRALQPDVVLLDLGMPKTDGAREVTAIRQVCPDAKILVVTGVRSDPQALSALELGARGCLSKEASPDELLAAIHNLTHGQAYLPPAVAVRALRRLDFRADDGAPDPLTKREEEVLALVAQGCSNLEIGDRLVITKHTASKHVSSILGKLHLTHRVQAALYAAQRGQAL